MRTSQNREKIKNLFEKEHVLSARECHKKLPQMDLATVYRNLKQLAKLGFLKEVHINNEELHYELNSHDHQHLICDNCGNIESVVISEDKINRLLKETNFLIEELELNIHGKCKNCKD
jgi:Fur family peroxide stress response transcriptional regulator